MLPISENATRQDIDLLLWFEPERVTPNTALHKEHPEWIWPTSGDAKQFAQWSTHLFDDHPDWLIGASGPGQGFGQWSLMLNIGNKDPVLVIIDIVSKPTPPLKGPEGKAQPSPAWAPKIVEKGTTVTSLDFAGTPKPDGKLRSAVLIQGTGATVKKGQTITVNYLGQVYKGKKPFDESYSKQPASFAIGTGAVISGWDKTLVGQKVGSRVILAIPPKEGYGKKGQPTAGIKGTDTLYFVVDILGAS